MTINISDLFLPVEAMDSATSLTVTTPMTELQSTES